MQNLTVFLLFEIIILNGNHPKRKIELHASLDRGEALPYLPFLAEGTLHATFEKEACNVPSSAIPFFPYHQSLFSSSQ